MTDDLNTDGTPLRPELLTWCEAWRDCLQSALSQVSGQPAAFEISSELLPAAETDVWYTVVAAGALRGEMTLRLPAASALRLARKFLGEPEPPAAVDGADTSATEAVPTESKEALEELLRQIAGLTATSVGAAAGGEVRLQLSASPAPSWSAEAVVCLLTRDEAGTAVTIEIKISTALAEELRPRIVPPVVANPTAASPTPHASSPPPPPPTPPPPVDPVEVANYRRLMDVGLDVKLRFGTRRMLLRDVLALSAGVVVELDNTLHSPVDLLLDGRLIAQGDVVIVDGKYGLRVTNVVEPPPPGVSPV
ncbi:MAG TPA: FliM/FliN family flagellar motor switch protein [Terriglobales bacterium]|nr:FliM/FliN family flagellar motor switch protein [Terriglobales bacterium]